MLKHEQSKIDSFEGIIDRNWLESLEVVDIVPQRYSYCSFKIVGYSWIQYFVLKHEQAKLDSNMVPQ